ncbi:MAG: adenine deaminase [Gaiellaceae bacterium]
MVDLARRIAVARGDEPADLVLKGGRVLSVFTREWLEADVAIADGYVAGLGDYEGRETVDVSGKYVVPGFIDAHMHLESTKLLPDEFARLVLPLGTTAVVADPHEIANVLGADGVHWLVDFCAELPLDVYFMAPSCVPASPFESPRSPLTDADLESLMARDRVLGLGEMMNFPGVVSGEGRELSKLGLRGAGHVDGHAPSLAGKDLNAYAASGIRSDHEALTLDEGRARLRAGIWLLVREASMARSLVALAPLVQEFGPSQIAFCTDDRDPDDIVDDGHINGMVRKAVAAGVAPADAIVCASFNSARWHGLSHLGALAPGYQADVLVLPDLEAFRPELVLKAGRRLTEFARPAVPEWVQQSVRIAPVSREGFAVPECDRVRAIGLVPDQVVTESLVVDRHADDLAKIAVVERHHATGRIGLGFVHGSGMQRGALASTVAHDAHNIVVLGVSDDDMLAAVEAVVALGGGIVAVDGGRVVAQCPLPVAGLFSLAALDEVIAQTRECNDAAHAMGWSGATPFLTMSFLGLSVIPALKITDQGLVDVERFEVVPLCC